MATTAADVLIDILLNWGAEVIFGIPGDGIISIIQAIRKHQDRLRFIQVRHEEAAAVMACGYAKFTGKLGVCLASSGPGGIHLLNGLYDAKMDGQPVLAITGTPFHDLMDTYGQQDVALDRLFMDVALYNTRIMGPAHVENVANLACRTALTQHGVAHITFPMDIQSETVEGRGTRRNVPHHTSSVFAQRARLPYEGDIRKAAEILNAGKRTIIMAGRGAMEAASEIELIADMLGGPVIKTLMGKAVFPDDSPFVLGSLGPLGTKPALDAIHECDTLLMVGTSYPYIEYLPKPGQARAVQIDLDATRIGLRYPIEVGLVGDSQRTLKMMLPSIERHSDRAFLEKYQQAMEDWKIRIFQSSHIETTPIKPQMVAWELGDLLPENAILACDSGSITTWWSNYLKVKRGQMQALSGNLASLGMGLPYAIAAQVAYPDRPCVAFVGDGGFSMLMAEFATCVKYELPVKVVLLKDNRQGQVKGPRQTPGRLQEFSFGLQPIQFSLFAQACGGIGMQIESPSECRTVLEQALALPEPVLVEVLIDPDETSMVRESTETS